MTLEAALLTAAALAIPMSAQNSVTKLEVSALMDPWRAAGYDDGSDGEAPASVAFIAGPNQFITFPSIVGTWDCGRGVPFSPDGILPTAACAGPEEIADPVGTFAGYFSTDFTGGLVGMFLEDYTPQIAPAPLRFYVSDSTQGGIATNFRILFPRIGQVFFIGDGLTGTGTGELQRFFVPPSATHVYFGYVDEYGSLYPSGYYNNVGSLRLLVHLQQSQ